MSRSPVAPRYRRLGILLLLIASVLPAVQPLLKGALPWRADGLLHFHRLAQLDRSLRHGNIFPRWAPDMGFGFGFPLFNYYAPLSYYIAEPLHLLGLSHQAALLGAFILAVFAASVGAYLLGRDLFGPQAGFLTALAYVYAPYTLFNVIHRGALAEAWGLAWLPFTFWALRGLAVRGRRIDLALCSLFYAVMLLTHNILALVSTPLLLVYAVILWSLHGRDRALALRLGAAMALGLGMAAFFWAPAFFERHYVQIHQLYAPADLNYRNNFMTLRELLASPQPVDPAQINAPIPLSFGWPQIALALVALFGIWRFDEQEERWHLMLLGLGLLALTAMMLPLSIGIWDMIPLLRFIQFPWRFLGPTSLFLAVLAGAGLKRLPTCEGVLPPLLLALLIIFSLTWLFPGYYPDQPEPNPVRLIDFEKETGALGTTSAGDYLPIWVREVPPADRLLPAYRGAGPDFIIPRLTPGRLPSGARVMDAHYGPTTANLVLYTPIDFVATFDWYFFPGWQAQLDGQPQSLHPIGEYGLIGVEVPAGHHRLQIEFGATPLRRWASIISLASFVVLLISLGLWRGGEGSDVLGTTGQSSRVWIRCLLVALTLFGLKFMYLDRQETIFRRTRFDGVTVTGVQTPLRVNFGDELVLLGYEIESAVVPADGLLGLDLYWTAAQPLVSDYSIAVHLVDDQGRRYGQDDSQHPGGYPTSRWQLGKYARDSHRLAPWSGTPPGEYTLLIGVYDVTSGGHLEVRDAGGSPLGTTHSLADVQVTRATYSSNIDNIAVTREMRIDLSGSIRLLGFDPSPSEVDAGGRLPLTLYWQATMTPMSDHEARLSLIGSDGARFAVERSVPGRSSYPTSAWRKGDVVRDGRSLLIPATVPDGDYILAVDLLNQDDEPMGESAVLMDVSVRAPDRQFEMPAVDHPLSITLGNQATLLGYDLADQEISAGESLTITLYWRAETTPRTSYVVFVHLLDQVEEIYVQSDSVPAAGARPTTGWVPGEIVRDPHHLVLPPDAPSSQYQLEVGMYDPTDGERLRTHDGQDMAASDHIRLPALIRIE